MAFYSFYVPSSKNTVFKILIVQLLLLGQSYAQSVNPVNADAGTIVVPPLVEISEDFGDVEIMAPEMYLDQNIDKHKSNNAPMVETSPEKDEKDLDELESDYQNVGEYESGFGLPPVNEHSPENEEFDSQRGMKTDAGLRIKLPIEIVPTPEIEPTDEPNQETDRTGLIVGLVAASVGIVALNAAAFIVYMRSKNQS